MNVQFIRFNFNIKKEDYLIKFFKIIIQNILYKHLAMALLYGLDIEY